jgi:hypothetical protein
MSSTNSNKESSDNSNNENESLDSIQENQDNVGAAESDPSTSGPTDNTRAEAAEETDTSE